MDTGRTTPGIAKLRELIEEHPAELTFDFRTKFQLSIHDIGDRITWLEAVYLVAVLLRDPTSWLQAVHAGWKHPVSQEWMVAVHTYDLLAAVNSKNKPKPYPTPWPSQNETRVGSSKPRSRAEVIKRLEQMNPKENDAS